MKKSVTVLVIVMVMILSIMLTACGENSEKIPTTISTTDIEVIKSAITKSKEDISAYLSLLDMQEESLLTHYALVYIDNNDKQELVIGKDDFINVYSISTDGVIACLVSNLNSVSSSYYERKGVIEEWIRFDGGGDDGSYAGYYYVITEDNPYDEDRKPDFGYEYNAVYDEDGNWTETGITDYYSDGNKVSEVIYKEIFEQHQISEWYDDAEEKEEGKVGRRSFF